MDETLRKIYFDPSHPAAYGGKRRLEQVADDLDIPSEKVDRFLMNEDAYTLHHPVKKKFKTNATRAHGVDGVWQCDLTDLSHLKKYNDGYRYILFTIDVVSRYLWVKPLKTKTAKEVSEALREIMFTSKRFPGYIHTDAGKEFEGDVHKYLDALNIDYYVTGSPNKAAICERVQRTIKEKMYRYFTKHGTRRYLDVLDKLVEGYNNAYHRTIKMTPNEVISSKKNEERSLTNLYSHLKAPKNYKFESGDHVRISRLKDFTEKGYEVGWSREVFIIDKVLKHQKPVPAYILRDLMGEKLKGAFNEEELQHVVYDEQTHSFPVEKIIKTVGKGKEKKYLVKFLGWPDKFNAYISASQLQDISSLL